MNRIQIRAQRPDEVGTPTVDIDGGLFTTTRDCRSPHTLFAPLHYEPNYAYPLLIWLHGSGGDEHQLRRVMPLISMRNYVAGAPRGPLVDRSRSKGYDWGNSESEVAAATRCVFECVEAVGERFHIAPQRVFLVGYESGGTMAFRIGLRHPEAFAGVLSVGGPFPTHGSPLATIRQVRGLPLFIAQGRDSQQYPLERTCEELRLFHAAGLSVTLRQYPCGDELNTQMLHDIDVWVMEQVTGVSSDTGGELSNSLELN